MTIGKFLLLVALFLFAAVPICLSAIYLQKHSTGKDYDERQQKARGEAYGVSYVVGQVYYILLLIKEIGDISGKEPWIETALLLYFGFVLQFMVFHTYCLLTHADLPWTSKSRNRFWDYALCAVIHFAPVWFPNAYKGFSNPLQLTGDFSGGLFLVTNGVLCSYLAVLHAIQYFRDRHGE